MRRESSDAGVHWTVTTREDRGREEGSSLAMRGMGFGVKDAVWRKGKL